MCIFYYLMKAFQMRKSISIFTTKNCKSYRLFEWSSLDNHEKKCTNVVRCSWFERSPFLSVKVGPDLFEPVPYSPVARHSVAGHFIVKVHLL